MCSSADTRATPNYLIRSLPALSPSPLGLYDLCRGFPARSIRERAVRGASARVALDLFPSPRGDGVAAFIEFDMVNEGLDRFTR